MLHLGSIGLDLTRTTHKSQSAPATRNNASRSADFCIHLRFSPAFLKSREEAQPQHLPASLPLAAQALLPLIGHLSLTPSSSSSTGNRQSTPWVPAALHHHRQTTGIGPLTPVFNTCYWLFFSPTSSNPTLSSSPSTPTATSHNLSRRHRHPPILPYHHHQQYTSDYIS